MTSPSKIKTTEIVYKDVKQVFSIFLSNRTFRTGYEIYTIVLSCLSSSK